MLGKHVFAYLDDIIVAGKNPEKHLANLELVYQRLQAAGLRLKLTKYESFRSKINCGTPRDTYRRLKSSWYKTVSAT